MAGRNCQVKIVVEDSFDSMDGQSEGDSQDRLAGAGDRANAAKAGMAGLSLRKGRPALRRQNRFYSLTRKSLEVPPAAGT